MNFVPKLAANAQPQVISGQNLPSEHKIKIQSGIPRGRPGSGGSSRRNRSGLKLKVVMDGENFGNGAGSQFGAVMTSLLSLAAVGLLWINFTPEHEK